MSSSESNEPAGGDVVREALEKVRRWAESRCPCHNEEPNPCPLCGASVENLEVCKSAENTLPRELLTTIRAALSPSTSAAEPVAWIDASALPLPKDTLNTSHMTVVYASRSDGFGGRRIPLYATPPAPAEPVKK